MSLLTSLLFLILAARLLGQLSVRLGGKLIGLPKAEALGVGIILNGRGVIGVVVASIAHEKGFIGQGLFTTLVLMSLATTVLTPILFKKFVLRKLALPQGYPNS